MLFTRKYYCVLFCIFTCFRYGNASRSSLVDEGSYLSQSLDVSNHVEENWIMMEESRNNSLVFDVRNYGAKGDGNQDDTQAFQAAWTAACAANNGIMLVPTQHQFLIQTTTFSGNKCQSNIMVQVHGEIVAPVKSAWKEINEQWILFTGLKNGLTITGNGIIDGCGGQWWKDFKSNEKSLLQFNGDEKFENKKTDDRPHGIKIENSNHVTVTGLRIQNTPQMHIFFSNCQDVTILDLTVSSPENSPNTDGIHLSQTQNVKIHDSTIACGDDCISIQSGCSNVKIYNTNCGPGHGYSIGSLGFKGVEAHVYDIGVYNSTVTNAANGVRIKAWASATGSAQRIAFDNIVMSNINNPIIIDQHYCNGREFCSSASDVDNGVLAISGITYNNIRGTYTERSVAIVCSEHTPCRDIFMSNINLNPTKAKGTKKSYCSNVYGKLLSATTPPLDDCISSSPRSATENMAYNERW